ncbi:T9SS type A sorting domain-containing protein [Flavobacteriaceae bacterium TK19130]|nr:T9SS type A sorting domain-containing protein [Thermobacterium salinum]
MKRLILPILFFLLTLPLVAQEHSIARQWNEEVLNGIRNDFARPTVHARNLFHTSVAMYDIWSVFDRKARPFFLGNTVGDFFCPFEGFSTQESVSEARKKAISYAVYRIMKHRFANSPGVEDIFTSIEALMASMNYDPNFTDTNYKSGNPAALGNYVAEKIIAFGMQDGANEAGGYENQFYEPLNDPLNLDTSGNISMEFPNHWQPLKVENWVDQSGNTIPGGQPPFLSPEWGQVVPFSLTEADLEVFETANFDYYVYHNPGDPWYIQEGLGLDDPYKWGFTLVGIWGSHLDPNIDTRIDISPASLGNLPFERFPESFEEFGEFYDLTGGGDPSTGRELNPVTGQPYEPQLVKLGDYGRVLAEFWADGPDSETPPGHWFTILNTVSDHPQLEKRFKGEGEVLNDLEWDVKSYFMLGGTMHDVAVTSWGIKGYYDYVRPVSAIRYMATKGQSSDPNLPSYHPHGIPLLPGYIEIVDEDDPLSGAFDENVGRIKIYTWKGPEEIIDPNEDIAGVGWMFAEEWFPYQRPSFVTPPFAGYVSGHSTFSRAAAEIMTQFTGSEYFPGGMGVFEIPEGEFLKFEKGPTESFELQWATYFDASDQTSLSRIWGGIHPPVDDIPGRRIGDAIGKEAFAFAEKYFTGQLAEEGIVYPNPARDNITLFYDTDKHLQLDVFDMQGRLVLQTPAVFDDSQRFTVSVAALQQGVYILRLSENDTEVWSSRVIKQ